MHYVQYAHVPLYQDVTIFKSGGQFRTSPTCMCIEVAFVGCYGTVSWHCTADPSTCIGSTTMNKDQHADPDPAVTIFFASLLVQNSVLGNVVTYEYRIAHNNNNINMYI